MCDVLNVTESGSIASVKGRGLRGHPCLEPLESWKHCERVLLVITAAFGEEYNSLVQVILLGPNPNLSNEVNKQSYSTRSKAFSASRETTTSGVSDVIGEYTTLSTLRILVNEWQTSINPVWSIDTIYHCLFLEPRFWLTF